MEGVGQLLIDGNNKLKGSVKSSDRAGVSKLAIRDRISSTIRDKHVNY